MKIYDNGENWIIESQLNLSITIKIKKIIDDNLNFFLKLKEGYSTTGESVEQYWLIHKSQNFYYKSPEFNLIKNLYKKEIIDLLKKSDLMSKTFENKFDIDSNNCWSVIGKEHSYHVAHHHDSGSLSSPYGLTTILYLSVPETNNDENFENNIYLILGSSQKNTCYKSVPNIITVNPEFGKVLIFPNWIIHGTYPQSKGIRQTFNLDFNIKFKNDINIIY